jgi:pyrimidine operon attenuation protein/uracil phosphoribosyltransferase
MALKRTLVLNARQIEQKINRIAYEIFENNYDEKEIIVAGISGSGYVFARRLEQVLKSISGIRTSLIEVTVNKKNPLDAKKGTKVSAGAIEGKVIMLVDDVLNSGKTLIYGAKLFLDAPVKKLSTVVLVDRNHTRYPVKADYVGLSLSTTMQEHITVALDGKEKDAVYLE